MEVALIPGVLALGETIACQLGCAAAEYGASTSRSQSGSATGRSHPGIYSSNNSNMNSTRTHSGIYCNPASQRLLPVSETAPLPECHSYHSDMSDSSSWANAANSPPISARSGCESEVDSPCPTARLAVANKFCTDAFNPENSPITRDLLAPSFEKLCPPRSGSPFGMESPRGLLLEKVQTTSTKSSAGNGYLLSLDDLLACKKHAHLGSNSTASTCSDLDISCRTASAASSSASNASEHTEEVASPRSEILKSMPAGASPIDQTVVVARKEPIDVPIVVSKARSFCQKAFEECELDNLDEEMADLTKDLEALRASMATSKRVLCASPKANARC